MMIDPSLESSSPGPVLKTKAGLPKRKLSLEDKLIILGLGEDPEVTFERVEEFRRLFAFRCTKSIVAKGGHRNWKAHNGTLGSKEVVHHLLADRLLPNQQPIWYGARSFETSMFLCVDVDADDPTKLHPEKDSFTDRCAQVKRAFRRMGVDPDNPRSVLVQATPRRGKHFYLFLDNVYELGQYKLLLNEAGLRHCKGQIEFFPSTSNGFRLPFGYLPGQPHDLGPGFSSSMTTTTNASSDTHWLTSTTTFSLTTTPSISGWSPSKLPDNQVFGSPSHRSSAPQST